MNGSEPSTPEPDSLPSAPRPGLFYENLERLPDRVQQALSPKERLKPAEVRVLGWLIEHNRCPEAQLIKETALSKQAVSSILSSLIERRLIDEQPDRHDRRKHILLVKKAGKELLASIDQLTDQLLREANLSVAPKRPSTPPPPSPLPNSSASDEPPNADEADGNGHLAFDE